MGRDHQQQHISFGGGGIGALSGRLGVLSEKAHAVEEKLKGVKPTLVRTVVDDFWETTPPPESDHFWAGFDVVEVKPGMAGDAHLAWVQAYQESQRQTADAHSAYQRAMADTHMAFLRASESSLAGLSSMVTGQPRGFKSPNFAAAR